MARRLFSPGDSFDMHVRMLERIAGRHNNIGDMRARSRAPSGLVVPNPIIVSIRCLSTTNFI